MKQKNFLYFALVAVTSALLFYALFRKMHWDEIEAIHTSWKVAFEGHIYKDFFQHHHPFLYYLLAPFCKLFGPTAALVYFFRLLVFLIFLGTGYVTYLLAKAITNNTATGMISALFLFSTPMFSISAIEIRPDVPMTFFATLAIALWFLYLKKRKTVLLVASAVLFSISFLFLQKAAITIFFFGLVVLAQLFTQKVTFKELFLYAGSFLVLPSLYLGHLIYTGMLPTYFTYNWLFNMSMTCQYCILPEFFFAFRSNIPICACFFVGFIYAIKKPALQPIVFLGISLLGIIFCIKIAGPQYFMPAFPFTSIVAACGFMYIVNYHKALFFPLIALIVFPPIIINFIRKPFVTPLHKQIQKINYVLSITNENDCVLDYSLNWNLFRKDCDYVWYGTRFAIPAINRIEPYVYDVYEVIERKKPKVISKEGINTNNSLIKTWYKKSNAYNTILIRKGTE